MRRETVVYGQDHEFQVFDCLVPHRASGPTPVVVCIHGGGWHGGTRADTEPCGRLLVAAGFAAILADYRLTGKHPHPAQIEDMEAILAWIAREGAKRWLDRTRVAVTGASAGGHLSALLGLRATRRADAPCRVRCMIPVCGVHDISRWLADRPDMLHCVEPMIGGPVQERADVMREASPLFQVHRHAPPCLCPHGADDDLVPVSQSEALVDALRKDGVAAELAVVPCAGHTADQPDTKPAEPLGGWPLFHEFLRKHMGM